MALGRIKGRNGNLFRLAPDSERLEAFTDSLSAKQTARGNMLRVSVNKTSPGMILEEDVLDQKGRLLVRAGEPISDKHIRIFKIWGVTEVCIRDGDRESHPSEESHQWLPEESLTRAEDLVRYRFPEHELDHPFISELYRICVERTAKSLNRRKSPQCEANAIQKATNPSQTPPPGNFPAITISGLVNERLKLPTLPHIYHKILEAVHDPSLSIADIAKIVSKDPSLSAKILQLVNSSFYSLLKKVDTQTRALALIGTNHLMTIVTGVSVMSIFKHTSSTVLCMNRFWEHSISCGIVARMLSSYIPGVINSERYFVGGLLHDIGRLVLVQGVPRQMMHAFHIASREGISLHEAETEVLGFDHTEVGDFLAEKWNLPHSLRTMIRCHHDPRDQTQRLDPQIIYVADYMVNVLQVGFSGEKKIPPFLRSAWDELCLSPTILEPVVLQMDHQLHETIELIYGHH